MIIGGYGDDSITIGSGDNIVLGDNGYVSRQLARSASVTSPT